MLSNLSVESIKSECLDYGTTASRFKRCEEEDMQKAISYLYEFKRKLDTLHPNCLRVVESLLQNYQKYY